RRGHLSRGSLSLKSQAGGSVMCNRLFAGNVSSERTALLALYHDAAEALTGDLPAPVKYFNPKIKNAYTEIETAAARRLLDMIPSALKTDYQRLFFTDEGDREPRELVKAADKLCAYLKCLEEIGAGNQEFAKAEKALRAGVEELDLPEVRYFLDTFVPSFRLTLDELD